MAARSARLPSPVRWQAGATARRARYSAGAAGACVMSGFMTAPDPARLVGQLRKEAEL